MPPNRMVKIARLLALNTLASASWLPPRLRVAVYRLCGVTIGKHVLIHSGCVIRPGRLSIGSGSFLNYGCIIESGSASIHIGRRVALGPRVALLGTSHEIGSAHSRAGRTASRSIEIGDGCWLGAGVLVMPGVTIASGCVIGAGSVVVKSTEPNGLYVGSPARLVRTLDGPAGGADGDR